MNKKNEVFFADRGITSTSANYLANIAQEIITKDKEELNSARFITTTVDVIGSSATPKISHVGKSKDYVDDLPKKLHRISELNAFCAWVREAIKAKDFELDVITYTDISNWCNENDMPLPSEPRFPKTITDMDILAEWNIKERNEYYTLEAFASTFGKYIHADAPINNARKAMHEKIANPITKEGSGRDLILYYHAPSVDTVLVDTTFEELQNTYRSYEQRLNALKYKLKEEAAKRNMEMQHKYEEEHAAYQREMEAIRNKFNTWRIEETERISKLRIVIPDGLKETFDMLNNVGKGANS